MLRRARRRAVLLETALRLAESEGEQETAAVALEGVRRLIGPGQDVVLTAVDAGGERFEVLASSTPGAARTSGAIDDHPFLGRLPLDRKATLPATDPRTDPTIAAHLRAGGVRTLLHQPLVAPDGAVVACLSVLWRTRFGTFPREAEELCRIAASALAAALRRGSLERERERTAAAGEAVRQLAETIRGFEAARTADEVVGGALRGLRALDEESVGAVVGLVSEGVVVRVSAVGTTPRSFVESLKGTRLGGFDVGRRILESHEPIFTGPADVSLATRTRIMDPLDARSLLAAGGRDTGEVRIVVSSYRRSPEPPPAWALWGTTVLLDSAASVIARLEHSDALGTVADAVSDGVAILRRGWDVAHANDAARSSVPELTDGTAPAYQLDGEALPPDELPVVAAWDGDRAEAVLRHTLSGRMHHLLAIPLGPGACFLVIREEDEEGMDEPSVTDLGERRARRAR